MIVVFGNFWWVLYKCSWIWCWRWWRRGREKMENTVLIYHIKYNGHSIEWLKSNQKTAQLLIWRKRRFWNLFQKLRDQIDDVKTYGTKMKTEN